MATLNDLWHFWGTDLTPSGAGDLLAVSGTARGQQRVLRRLLTNPATAKAPGDYVFHGDYGAGLPSFIGKPIDKQKVIAVILSQMLLEDSVARTPTPVVTLKQIGSDNTAYGVNIAYNDAATNAPVTLAFSVGI